MAAGRDESEGAMMTKVKEAFVFEVDGVDHQGGDDDLDGRLVRSISGHDPAANFRLIEIHDRYTSSVGLEEPIKLVKGRKRRFRCFEGDRDYGLTVEDRGWDWGTASIAEKDVREIAKIADDREIVVEALGQPEIVVPRGGSIDLAGQRVERVYSRKVAASSRLKLVFVVNGEPTQVEGKVDAPLSRFLEKALKESENEGQPADAWQVTDEPGNPLDLARSPVELGLENGAVLLASLKAGAAG